MVSSISFLGERIHSLYPNLPVYKAKLESDTGSKESLTESTNHKILLVRSVDLPKKPLEEEDVFRVMDHLRFVYETLCYYLSTARPSKESETNKLRQGLSLIESSETLMDPGNQEHFTRLVSDLKKEIDKSKSELDMYDKNLEACRKYIVEELKTLRVDQTEPFGHYIRDYQWPTVKDCQILETTQRLSDFVGIQTVIQKIIDGQNLKHAIRKSKGISDPFLRRRPTQRSAQKPPEYPGTYLLPTRRKVSHAKRRLAPEAAADNAGLSLDDSKETKDALVPSPSQSCEKVSELKARPYLYGNTVLPLSDPDTEKDREDGVDTKSAEKDPARALDRSPASYMKFEKRFTKRHQESFLMSSCPLGSDTSTDLPRLALRAGDTRVSGHREIKDVTVLYPKGTSGLFALKEVVIDYKNKARMQYREEQDGGEQYGINIGIPSARFRWIKKNLAQSNVLINYSEFVEEQDYCWFRLMVGKAAVCRSVYNGYSSNIVSHNHDCIVVKRPRNNINGTIIVCAKLVKDIKDSSFTFSFELLRIFKQDSSVDILNWKKK